MSAEMVVVCGLAVAALFIGGIMIWGLITLHQLQEQDEVAIEARDPKSPL